MSGGGRARPGGLIARKINNSQDEAKLQARDSGPEVGGNMWSGWRESNSHYQLGKYSNHGR